MRLRPHSLPSLPVLPSALALGLAALSLSSAAVAAPPFVERRQTLPARTAAIDTAAGMGRYDNGPGSVGTGFGGNFDLGIGLKEHVELGVGLGMRFGTDGKFAAADNYAKSNMRSFGQDGNAGFTPEVRLKSQVADAGPFEFSLELRGGLSVGDVPPGGIPTIGQGSSRPSVGLGAPVALHVGSILRLDSGAFVRVVFASQVRSAVLLPAELWIQPTSRFWFGPHAGLLVTSPGTKASVQGGLGLGYQVHPAIDLKTQFMFPTITETRDTWGVGIGAQFRVE